MTPLNSCFTAVGSATFAKATLGSVGGACTPVVKLIENGMNALPPRSFTPEVTTKVYCVLESSGACGCSTITLPTASVFTSVGMIV